MLCQGQHGSLPNPKQQPRRLVTPGIVPSWRELNGHQITGQTRPPAGCGCCHTPLSVCVDLLVGSGRTGTVSSGMRSPAVGHETAQNGHGRLAARDPGERFTGDAGAWTSPMVSCGMLDGPLQSSGVASAFKLDTMSRNACVPALPGFRDRARRSWTPCPSRWSRAV